MIHWEYKVVKMKNDGMCLANPGSETELQFLIEQSRDGWEHYFTYIGVMLYYFKRQITENK